MKGIIASILMLLGVVGGIVGKFGTIISVIVWVVGLLGVIPAISFGWVILFVGIFIAALVSATAGVVVLGR